MHLPRTRGEAQEGFPHPFPVSDAPPSLHLPFPSLSLSLHPTTRSKLVCLFHVCIIFAFQRAGRNQKKYTFFSFAPQRNDEHEKQGGDEDGKMGNFLENHFRGQLKVPRMGSGAHVDSGMEDHGAISILEEAHAQGCLLDKKGSRF